MARLDFVNARLRARKTDLVSPASLRDLLARSGLEARLEALRRGALGRALQEALARDAEPLAAVEAALREALRREAGRILAAVEGTRPRALLGAFLELDAAEALKRILRGVAVGAPRDAILAGLPPAPGIPESELRELAGAVSVEALADALERTESRLAAPLRGALPARARRGLAPVEAALDGAAFALARTACARAGEDGRILGAHLRDRIDARNAATLLALAGAAAAVDAFVPGGERLSAAALAALAAGPVEAARAAIAAAFPRAAPGLGSPWGADRALERAVLVPLARTARTAPLSLAVPLAYLAARRAEIRRVSLVLRGAELALPADEILDLVEA